MTKQQFREFGRNRRIKVEIEDSDLLGIMVTVSRIKKRPDVELTITDYVRENVTYEVDGLELQVTFTGELSELPIGTRVVIKVK